jgi:hypothetical protein
MDDFISYFDPQFKGLGVCLPFEEMSAEQFAQWREDYYAGLIAHYVFGYDDNGQPNAPHGWSIHGAPKLRPEDQ